MPIVESRIDKIEPQRPGRIRVYFFFRDHTGHIESPILDVPEDFDTTQYLVDREIFLNANAIQNEVEIVETQVLAGADPAEISVDHITPKQRLRAIIMGMMRGRPHKIIRAAEWLDANISKTQLAKVIVDATRRARIRSRVAGVLALKTSLEADEVLRDD